MIAIDGSYLAANDFSHATVLFHQSPDIPDVGARPAWICTYMAEVIINANAQVKSKLI
jgi:hypothetical protein